MLEDQFYRSKLISGYLRGELSGAEEEELNAWLAASPENINYLQQEFGSEEKVRHLLRQYNSLDENALWDKVSVKLQVSRTSTEVTNDSDKGFRRSDGDSKEQAKNAKGNKIYSLNYKLAAAAALFIIGTLSFMLFHFIGTNNPPKYSTNIGAGKSGATLTLADGRKIRLSDAGEGQLAEESGMRITKTAGGQIVYTASANHAPADARADALSAALADVHVKNRELQQQLNTLATSNGEQYQLILPDQTKVWLNAGSSITFPASFAGLYSRNVAVTGEVYFEVAKVYTTSLRIGIANPIQRVPFIVTTTGQQVEVLGTHFNINAYSDEPSIKTTLLEGNVAVRNTANKGEKAEKVENADHAARGGVLLAPGQQSILQGQHLKVVPADIENATAWKKGDFVFKGEDFKATMRKIARWYNVEIIYDPSVPADIELAGWISRKSRLSLVLERIELAGNIHFKVEGRRITIMK